MADSIVGSALDVEQKRVFYVYLISRPDGRPCYVGKGSGKRLNAHFQRTHNAHLQAIINAAGGKLPVHKLASNLPEGEAYELEEFLISVIGRKENGGPLVNQSDGGRGGSSGRKMGQEELARRRVALGRPEVKQRMRFSHLGKPSARKGIKVPAESIEKSRNARLGHRHSIETKQKMSAARIGRKRPAEYGAAMSILRRGEKRSAEARKNMSEGRIGMKLSDSHKANIGKASRLRYANPENRRLQSERIKRWWAERTAKVGDDL